MDHTIACRAAIKRKRGNLARKGPGMSRGGGAQAELCMCVCVEGGLKVRKGHQAKEAGRRESREDEQAEKGSEDSKGLPQKPF